MYIFQLLFHATEVVSGTGFQNILGGGGGAIVPSATLVTMPMLSVTYVGKVWKT